MASAVQESPAPGDYHPESAPEEPNRSMSTLTRQLSGFHFTFSARRKEQLALQTPAPGDYEPDLVAPRATPAPEPTPRATSSALRRGSIGTRKGGVTFFGGDAPSHTLGPKAKAPHPSDNAPGPADYSSVPAFGSGGVAFSVPRSSAASEPHPRKADVPGPGKYKVKAPAGGPSYTMGGGSDTEPRVKPATAPSSGIAPRSDPVGPSFTIGRKPVQEAGSSSSGGAAASSSGAAPSADRAGPSFTLGRKPGVGPSPSVGGAE